MSTVDGTSGGGPQPVSDYPVTRTLEENAIYWASLPNGEGRDHWFWDYAMAGASGQDFTTSTSLANVAHGSGELTVFLQGYTHDPDLSPDHHARILFNGAWVDDAWWDGKSPYETTLWVSNITEGLNTVTIEMPGDTGAQWDVVYIDRFELTYSHTYASAGNLLDFQTPQVGDYTVTGFSTNDISVYNITDPGAPERLDPSTLTLSDLGGTYRVEFGASGSRYLTLTASALKSPDSIIPNTPSDLRSRDSGADEIIIAYGGFIDALAPLVSYRESQGLRVEVVDVEDVYDEFSFGNLDPQAIKDFLDLCLHLLDPAQGGVRPPCGRWNLRLQGLPGLWGWQLRSGLSCGDLLPGGCLGQLVCVREGRGCASGSSHRKASSLECFGS